MPGRLHTLSDEEIESLRATLLPRALTLRAGEAVITLPQNSPLYVHNMVALRVLQENWQDRPVYYSLTSGSDNWGLAASALTQEGLVLRVNMQGLPDTTRLVTSLFGVPLDVPATDSLTWEIYRYSRLFEADTLDLSPTSRNIAVNLSYAFYSLAQAYEVLGDRERSERNLRRALHLQPIPELSQMLQAGRDIFQPPPPPELADTPVTLPEQ